MVEVEEGVIKEDGSVYMFIDLCIIQDWIICLQLCNVKGVVEINIIGGYVK